MGLVEYFEAERLIKKHKIRCIESQYVKSKGEAVKFAGGKPIVLKVISENALHKSKSGLVKANLFTVNDISRAYAELVRKGAQYRPYRVIAQKMVAKGIEIIIGGNVDSQFGKLVLLGLGGIYVEAFRDFALRVCPIDKKEAKSMVEQLRSKSIIAGDAKHEKMIVDLLVNVSWMFMKSNLKELDLNPIILHDGTYDAVDLRMIR